jgi:hypothetical protein
MCLFTWPVNSGRSRRAGTPLRLFTQADTQTFGVHDQQVHVIVLPVELAQLSAEGAADLPHGLFAPEPVSVEHAVPVPGHEDQMGAVRGTTYLPRRHAGNPKLSQASGMVWLVQVRYRYRIYPSPGQRQALARAFGCARVVYNDCLRVREEAHAAGEKISDTEVQRRVITLAKLTPERAWLGEVASVALVQACQDARRAYKNWFGSLAGRRKGPKSVADAGWSQLIRCIEQKAAQYGRTFGKVGRFEPTSQVCSACGVKDGPKPLKARTWVCAVCGTVRDRDAARNILALGRRERLNACGTGVRPPLTVAAGAEAGTRRSAG